MDRVVILEHVSSEKAGAIGDYLVRERIPFDEIRLFAGARLPDLKDVSALVVMGGPMNVYEEGKYPFLKDEDRFIHSAVEKGIPYLGICLGSQLLAKALGARVMKARQAEMGWGRVELVSGAESSALFKGFGKTSLKVLQWHEDTFQLPKGATLLATNGVVAHQAFGVGDRAFGLQFHLEADRPMLADWFKDHADQKKILDEYDRYKLELSKITDRLCRNFFSL